MYGFFIIVCVVFLYVINFIFKALVDYIRLMINDDTIIGIVHFEKSARVVCKFLQAKDLKEKDDLIDIIIPKKGSNSNSNIWNGN